MKVTIRIYLCLGLLAAPGFAQEPKPTSPAFEKAMAVEQLEHDLKGAVKLYTELALAESTPESLKRRAFLRLGLVYRQLGQEDKAQAALGKAAAGTGDFALLAQAAMLKTTGVSKAQVELRKQAEAALLRAQAAIPTPTGEQMKGIAGEFGQLTGYWSPAAEDLVWLGSAAVPTLRKAFGRRLESELWISSAQLMAPGLSTGAPDIIQSSYRAFLCSILWENGSPEARTFLAELSNRADLNSQMAVVQGLQECGLLNPEMLGLYVEVVGKPNGSIVPIRAANMAAAWTNDRRKTPILTQLSPGQFLSLVDSATDAVAVDLWRHLDELNFSIRGLEAKHLDLAGTILTMLESSHPGLNQMGYKALARFGLQSVALRTVTLQFLESLPESFRLRNPWGRQVIGGAGFQLRGRLIQGADEILLFATALGSAGPAPSQNDARSSKIRAMEGLADLYYSHGGFDILAVVIELGKNGYWQKYQAREWLTARAQDVQLHLVTSAMVTSPIFDESLSWIKTQELDGRHVPGIIAAIERLYSKGLEARLKNPGGGRYPGGAWDFWANGLDCLAKIKDPSALAYLVQLAGNGEFSSPGTRILQMSSSGILGDLRDELRVTLSAKVVGEPIREDLDTRTRILARLVELGDVETMIDTEGWSGFEFLNPQVLAIGLEHRGTQQVKRGQFAFDWLVAEVSKKRRVFKPFHGYNAEQLALIWSHHLEHPNSFPGLNPYDYLFHALNVRGFSTGRFEGVVVPAMEAWLKRLKVGDLPKGGESRGLQELQGRCLGKDREVEPMNPMGMELISLSLRSGNAEVAYGAVRALGWPGDERWETDVRGWLTDGEVGKSALYYLEEVGLTLNEDEFRMISACKDRGVRKRLIEMMAQVAPKVPVELVFPMLADEDSDIRVSACAALAQRLDANAVPALLKVLGDGDENVRTAAKDALDQIRYYHDEKARWERFFQGQEVSTVGAAQMLLKQASVGQPEAQRVLAIRSLGTLGAPEVLPFLIEWAAQGPPTVVSAAKSAIERINLAGGATVDVK